MDLQAKNFKKIYICKEIAFCQKLSWKSSRGSGKMKGSWRRWETLLSSGSAWESTLPSFFLLCPLNCIWTAFLLSFMHMDLREKLFWGGKERQNVEWKTHPSSSNLKRSWGMTDDKRAWGIRWRHVAQEDMWNQMVLWVTRAHIIGLKCLGWFQAKDGLGSYTKIRSSSLEELKKYRILKSDLENCGRSPGFPF